jgi:hypothetical protein
MLYNIVPLAGPDLKMKDGSFRPLYKIDNQPLIIKTLKSRNWYKDDYKFIFILREVKGIDNLKNYLRDNFKYCKIVTVSDITKGALLSCLGATSLVTDYNLPICVDLADIIYECDLEPKKIFQNNLDLYGIIPSFKSNNPKFSYLEIQNNEIIRTKEKEVISNIASAGTYFFKDLSSFLEAVSWSLQNEMKISFNNNLFLCPSYNFFLTKQKRIINFEVKNIHDISTIIAKQNKD